MEVAYFSDGREMYQSNDEKVTHWRLTRSGKCTLVCRSVHIYKVNNQRKDVKLEINEKEKIWKYDP